MPTNPTTAAAPPADPHAPEPIGAIIAHTWPALLRDRRG